MIATPNQRFLPGPGGNLVPMPVKKRGEVQFPFQLSMFEQAGTLDQEFAHNDAAFDEDGQSTGGGATDEQEISRLREMKLEESSAPGSSVSAHWGGVQAKARRDGAPSLHDSIREGGVQKPVELALNADGRAVWDGHHRMYTAADVNPSMEVPVVWHEFRSHPDARNAGDAIDLRDEIPKHEGVDEAWEAVQKKRAENPGPSLPPGPLAR
jgi:hypothetical protein